MLHNDLSSVVQRCRERAWFAAGFAICTLVISVPTGFSQELPRSFVPPQDVQELLIRLGSARNSQRETATKRLIESESTRPHIELLLRAADPEIAARARRILTEHDRRYSATRLERYFAYGRDGQIERMIEGLTQWTGPIEDETLWEGVRAVANQTVRRLEHGYRDFKPHDFLYYTKRAKVLPNYQRIDSIRSRGVQDGGFCSSGATIESRHLANATYLSTGSVSAHSHTSCGILLTTEDFSSGNNDDARVVNFLIISAGRVTLHKRVDRTLVIARQGIDLSDCSYLKDSHFASSGKIIAKLPGENQKVKVESLQDQPLDFVKWFESSIVGFTSAPVKDAVEVTSVSKASISEVAGLRKGDLITSIDGEAVKKSADEFRKQLRRGSVQDVCVLTIKRGDKTHSVYLDFRDDNKK